MQLKTLTLLAASLALAQAKVNGTWGDHTKAPVLDTTTAPTLPTKSIEKPVDGGKTDVADETVPESSTWVDADVPEATKPVDGGKTDVADATKPVDGGETDVADETATPTASYWGDETSLPVDGGKTDVADETASSTATWADETSLPVDGGKTDVADETASSTATWADETSLPVDGGKTDVADETASSTASYWGDASLPVDGGKTDVADEVTSSTTAHWSDVTNVADLTTTEETTVEEVTKTVTKGDGSKITTVEVNTKTITHTVTVYPTPAPAPPKETPVLGGECGVVTVTNTVVKTITVPAGGEKPTGPPPAATTPVVVTSEEPKSWVDAVIPSAVPTVTAAPVSGGYMGIVETWRSKMGLKALELDSKLQSNAQDASDSSGGALKHKLNPGSMAQVMAPGESDNFESVFVGGWLCELPGTPGLGSAVCNEMSKGWNYAGQTGHAEILTSGKYSKIGCGLGDGIWTCDLA